MASLGVLVGDVRCFRQLYNSANLKGNADRIKELLSITSVSPNAANQAGWSPLILASYYGHVDTVRVLLSVGADVHHENNDGWTALIYAAVAGHAETVEVLLGHDDPPNLQHGTKTNEGWTALMYVVHKGDREMVDLLVHRAEPPARILFETAAGASALALARKFQNADADLEDFLRREGDLQRRDLVLSGITGAAYGSSVPRDIAQLIAKFTTWF